MVETYIEKQERLLEGLKTIKGYYMSLSKIKRYLELKGYIKEPKTEEDKVENSSLLAETIDYQADCGKVNYISIDKGDQIPGLFAQYANVSKDINGFSFDLNLISNQNEVLKVNEFVELFFSHLVVRCVKEINIYNLINYIKEQKELGIENICDKVEDNIIVKNRIGTSENIINYLSRIAYNDGEPSETGLYRITISKELAWLNLNNCRKFSFETSELASEFLKEEKEKTPKIPNKDSFEKTLVSPVYY